MVEGSECCADLNGKKLDSSISVSLMKPWIKWVVKERNMFGSP